MTSELTMHLRPLVSSKDLRDTQWYVDRRIASPDGSYPYSEARWGSVEEYVEYLEAKYDGLKDAVDRVWNGGGVALSQWKKNETSP